MRWAAPRLRLGVAGALVVTALAAGTAAASAPAGATSARKPDATPRGLALAFLLDRGRYSSFEAADPTVELFPGDINNRGQISGEYQRSDLVRITSESGLYRDPRGRITTFDVPGAKGTEAAKLNDLGEVAGNYSDTTPVVNNDPTRAPSCSTSAAAG